MPGRPVPRPHPAIKEVLEGWAHFFERLGAAVTGDLGPDEWAAAPVDLNPLMLANAT